MEFMIWAIVGYQSCFCWLYRASPSSDAKNIISHFGIDHLVMSMYRVVSCVVGRGRLLRPVCSLGKTLLTLALLHFVFQGKIYLLLQVSPNSYFCIPVPYDAKDIFFFFFGVSVRRSCRSSQNCSASSVLVVGHRLGLLWCRMLCLGNEWRSFSCFWNCT